MKTLSDQILETIEYALEQLEYRGDKTFPSVVVSVSKKGKYIVLDDVGSEREVTCSLPNITLSEGNKVWVKIPNGKIKDMHICGLK